MNTSSPPIAKDRRLIDWLATLGHDVAARPEAVVEATFNREAAQWGLVPAELARLVRELYRTDDAVRC